MSGSLILDVRPIPETREQNPCGFVVKGSFASQIGRKVDLNEQYHLKPLRYNGKVA